MADAVFVQGDTAPAVVAQLLKSDGTPRPLTDVAEVRFQMRRTAGSRYSVNAVAEITDAATGMVRYQWASGDLSISAADYISQWQLTYDPIELVNEDGDWTVAVADEIVTVETGASHGLVTSDSISTNAAWTVNDFMAGLSAKAILSVPTATSFTFELLEQADQAATVETDLAAAVTSTARVQTTTPENSIEIRRQ